MINSLDFLRDDFPLLKERIRGKSLVYLDSGATAQKPQIVIDAMSHYYCNNNANVHRGIYTISERATTAYENMRKKIKAFINAAYTHEIIFTRGTTESINLVASSFGAMQVQQGDEVVISEMEHHSNIVPWQLLCERAEAKLKIIPVNDNGILNLDEYRKLLTERTKIVGLIHVSNVLGTVNPVKEMIRLAHQKNIPVLLDGAQAIPHMVVDVQDLDCDFYTFSGHKLYGPTGIGVLYGKTNLLEKMPPYQGGGDMIRRVSFEKTEYNVLPHKFEAGTPHIAGVIGLGTAIDYLMAIGFEKINAHEKALLNYVTQKLHQISGLKIIGNAPNKVGVISFTMEQAHPHDIATILDHEGIAIRAGHHCAMPLMERFRLPATARITFGLYNTFDDIDRLIDGLVWVNQIFNEKFFAD
ncbi:cysteine desulfurase CsdA [Coxiella-like endosymbiont of Rhipicephalus sanguineus]|uniref:cysteine desulfurase n=1 Tax=Coxiella-like endosymbiont of Rhipicephalus sanguineus TaxID=1955402 RepID=UPI0027E07196|nr:cysteine desulfurase [Coxiella-like endosymbiont of Rhipicephalus sanguineus]MBT8506644.1 cysteine desulfurase CsdA [Coxiella-like endosymbiont of Rhipicephalus sanguineus]